MENDIKQTWDRVVALSNKMMDCLPQTYDFPDLVAACCVMISTEWHHNNDPEEDWGCDFNILFRKTWDLIELWQQRDLTTARLPDQQRQ